MSEPSEKKQKKQGEKTFLQQCQEAGQNALVQLMYDDVEAMTRAGLPRELLILIAMYLPIYYLQHGFIIIDHGNGIFEARSLSGLVRIIGTVTISDLYGIRFTHATVTRDPEDDNTNINQMVVCPDAVIAYAHPAPPGDFMPKGRYLFCSDRESYFAMCEGLPSPSFDDPESETFDTDCKFDGPNHRGIMERQCGLFKRSRNEHLRGRSTRITDRTRRYSPDEWKLEETDITSDGQVELRTKTYADLTAFNPIPFTDLMVVRDIALAEDSSVEIMCGGANQQFHHCIARCVFLTARPDRFEAKWIVTLHSNLPGQCFSFNYVTPSLECAPESKDQITFPTINDRDVLPEVALAFIRQSLFGVPHDEQHELLLQSHDSKVRVQAVSAAFRRLIGRYIKYPYALH